MNGFVEKLAAAGHLTPEQVKDIEERVAEFVKAAEEDPTLLVDAHEKLGGIFDSMSGAGRRFGSTTMQQLPGATANFVALGLVGGAAGAATEAYKSVRDSLVKAKAYKAMMDQAGDRISDLPAQSIQQSFNTLYRVNPEYAKDPVVAAEFVRETNRSEAYPFQLLKTLETRDRGGTSFMDYQKLMPDKREYQTPESQASEAKALQVARRAEGLPMKG